MTQIQNSLSLSFTRTDTLTILAIRGHRWKCFQRYFRIIYTAKNKETNLQWKAKTKYYLNAIYLVIVHNIKLDIENTIFSGKIRIWTNFFAQKHTVLLLNVYQIIIFLHFFYTFVGHFFWMTLCHPLFHQLFYLLRST